MYDIKDFTFGYEIEFGDIDRTTVIPEELGSWEYAETDIVNLLPPYQYIACDPLGTDPPVGGEINVKPTKTIDDLVNRIFLIRRLFPNPTSSCVNHGHVHIFIPGLKDDIDALHRLTKWIQKHQAAVVNHCYGYYDHQLMKETTGAKQYLKYDGGRLMPDYMCENILSRASNFSEFIDQQCMGKDGVSRGRPFRYAINTYCMKHTGTIEFRCFRSSTHLTEIRDSITFSALCLEQALNGGDDINSLLRLPLQFPKFVYNHDEYTGWVKTKYSKERGNKVRKFYVAS